MVKPLAVFCAALFSCLAIAPAPARAAVPDQPPPPHFTVQLVSSNGSGCPAGSAAVTAAEQSEFWVTYAQYAASAGGGAKPGGFRESCHLNVLVGVPSGWTYGIASEQYRGFVQLGAGARGTFVDASYTGIWSGIFDQDRSLSGPMSNSFEFDDQQPLPAWAPCHYNGTLNIDSSLQVFQGADPSFFNEITLETVDIGPSAIYHLAFRQC